jgi:hypothetical protein
LLVRNRRLELWRSGLRRSIGIIGVHLLAVPQLVEHSKVGHV